MPTLAFSTKSRSSSCPRRRSCFRPLSVGDVVERQKYRGIAVTRYPPCVEQNGPASDRRKIALDLKRLEFTIVGNDRPQRRPEAGRFPVLVSQIPERNALRFLARGSEHGIEGPVGRLHPQVGVQDHQRVDHRVEDRLRVLTLVNRLLDARTESGHVREREHGALDPTVASRIGGQSEKEPPVALPDFAPARRFVGDHLRA